MRGRPLEIQWQDDEESLLKQYKNAKNVHSSIRLQSLWLLRRGKRIKDVSDVTGVSYGTLVRWVSWYREGGVEEVLRRVPGHNAPGQVSRLTAKQQATLRAKADAGDFKTIHDAVAWVKAEYGVEYKYQGLYDLLKRPQRR